MSSDAQSAFWYKDEKKKQSVRVLESVRLYRAAESAMRRRTQASMGMGENDLLALRFLIRNHAQGKLVSPKDIAAYLAISSASTSVLLDRLEKSGHLTRTPSPFDRRGLIIVPTVASDEEVRHTLGDMHTRMIAVADTLDSAEAETVIRFLNGMRDAVDHIDLPEG